MNELIKSQGPSVTMTSLELVEFINGQRGEGEAVLAHSDFLKKVPQVLGGGHGNFSDTYRHPQNGQTYPCYSFPKREACLMAMSYSYDLQAKVFDRMTALEAGTPAIPQTMAQALRLAADQAEQIEVQRAQIQAAQPKIQALDRIATSDGSLCITDAAKTLQIQPRKLTQLLQEKSWVYRRPMGSGYLAYQDRIQQGLMEHKVTTGEKSDGHEWTSTQPRITPKGLTKLAEVVRQAGAH